MNGFKDPSEAFTVSGQGWCERLGSVASSRVRLGMRCFKSVSILDAVSKIVIMLLSSSCSVNVEVVSG